MRKWEKTLRPLGIQTKVMLTLTRLHMRTKEKRRIGIYRHYSRFFTFRECSRSVTPANIGDNCILYAKTARKALWRHSTIFHKKTVTFHQSWWTSIPRGWLSALNTYWDLKSTENSSWTRTYDPSLKKCWKNGLSPVPLRLGSKENSVNDRGRKCRTARVTCSPLRKLFAFQI